MDKRVEESEFNCSSNRMKLEFSNTNLEKMMAEKYSESKLEDIFDGYEVEVAGRQFFLISNRVRADLKIPEKEWGRKVILSNLKLVPGIGEATERLLKEQGYDTIEDLLHHPRFGIEALRLLELLEDGVNPSLIQLMDRRFPKSHPARLHLSCLCDKEEFTFMDIETMGLSGQPIILIGVAKLEGSRVLVNQYLARNYEEEPGILSAFMSYSEDVLVTFNGSSFDIPYLSYRMSCHGLGTVTGRAHFDILVFSKRVWRDELPNLRLSTLERYILGLEREDDIPSFLVPHLYRKYLETNNIGLLVPVIQHNRQDIVSMMGLFSKLFEEF